jgi:signal transduction histidine kinase
VRVSLRRTAERLTIDIVDDGAPVGTPAGKGHGIAGMRERAVALGGTFEAGPVPPRGWRVLAHLPTSGRTST